MKEQVPLGWVGIDVGKGHHWICLIDKAATTVWSTKVINAEAAILDAVGGLLARGGGGLGSRRRRHHVGAAARSVGGALSAGQIRPRPHREPDGQRLPGVKPRPTPATPTSSPRPCDPGATLPK